MNKIDILKSLQRKESIKKRKLIFDLKNDSVGMNLFHNFKNSILFKKSKIIGSYYSIKDEFETSYINNQIIKYLSYPGRVSHNQRQFISKIKQETDPG